MSAQLPKLAKDLLDQAAFVTVATVNPDGSPQTSVLWATYEGEDILLSTIVGRVKERNWRRDPRTSVILFDPANAYAYAEVRGSVELTTDGGDELIQRLSQHYGGQRFTGDDGTDHVRVVARLRPEHVVTH